MCDFFRLVFQPLATNVLGLCEVAVNRSGKFRFRRHVAKANFYLLNYEKKPIKLAFADYEAENFQLLLNPPFCKTLVGGSTGCSQCYFPFNIDLLQKSFIVRNDKQCSLIIVDCIRQNFNILNV